MFCRSPPPLFTFLCIYIYTYTYNIYLYRSIFIHTGNVNPSYIHIYIYEPVNVLNFEGVKQKHPLKFRPFQPKQRPSKDSRYITLRILTPQKRLF